MDVQNELNLRPNGRSLSALTLAEVVPGSDDPNLRRDALATLEQTSRTFFIPISQLPCGLLEAIGAAYLCLRAIDDIEDHPILDGATKARLLNNISHTIQASGRRLRVEDLLILSSEYRGAIPEVSLRLSDWMALAPASIAHRIWDATATMSARMAEWAAEGFRVQTEADLDRYTMGVAGSVGLMLSDLWSWYDGTRTDRGNAIGFGRGLQAVNILRNRQEDLARGVDFYPDGWSETQMFSYARRNLALADAYIASLPEGPALNFCRIPLVLANATLNALEEGRPKLKRSEVLQLLGLDT